jgi:hypothetical protein
MEAEFMRNSNHLPGIGAYYNLIDYLGSQCGLE